MAATENLTITIMPSLSGVPGTPPPPPLDPCSNCPTTNNLPGWALGLLIFFAILLIISIGVNALLIYKRRRLQHYLARKAHRDMQRSSFHMGNNDAELPINNGTDQAPIMRKKTIALKKSRVEIPRENVGITVSLRSIGGGLFGNVWKGEARGLTVNDGHVIPVAAREFPSSLSENEVLDMITPLWRLKTHENVVQLYGCCLGTDPSYILSEYVTNGTLLTYLKTNGGITRASIYANMETASTEKQITPMEQRLYAFDVANGMEYLAERGIIHGNLCAHNILMTKEKRCKVADFGLSTQATEEKLSQNNTSRRWMSPERIADGALSIEGDVWSFGVLVWEIMTYGSLPYEELGEVEIFEKIKAGYRLSLSPSCDPQTKDLLHQCWQDNAKERPTFAKIKDAFGSKLEEEADYFALGSTMESYYACVDVIEP